MRNVRKGVTAQTLAFTTSSRSITSICCSRFAIRCWKEHRSQCVAANMNRARTSCDMYLRPLVLVAVPSSSPSSKRPMSAMPLVRSFAVPTNVLRNVSIVSGEARQQMLRFCIFEHITLFLIVVHLAGEIYDWERHSSRARDAKPMAVEDERVSSSLRKPDASSHRCHTAP